MAANQNGASRQTHPMLVLPSFPHRFFRPKGISKSWLDVTFSLRSVQLCQLTMWKESYHFLRGKIDWQVSQHQRAWPHLLRLASPCHYVHSFLNLVLCCTTANIPAFKSSWAHLLPPEMTKNTHAYTPWQGDSQPGRPHTFLNPAMLFFTAAESSKAF